MTWRRLRALYAGLPQESLTKTALRDAMTPEQWAALPAGDGWGPWSHTDHLLAVVADRLGVLDWTLRAVNSKPGSQPPPPEPLARPGVSGGPLGAPGWQDRRDALVGIARLQAIRANGGGEPTDEQVQAVLDELMGGGGDA